MWIKLVKNCPEYVARDVQANLNENLSIRVVDAGPKLFDLELDLSGLLSTAVNLAIVPVFNEFDSGANWASHMILEVARGWIEERNEK